MRPLAIPDSVVWTGSTDLPVIQDVRALGELVVVLLAEDGRLFRYEPITGQLEQVARVPRDAVFGTTAVSAVAVIDHERQVVHEVATDHVTEYPLEDSAAWASPVDGGLAVLTTSNPPRMRITRRTDSEVVLDVEVGGQAVLVTAWGKRIVLTGPGGQSVQIFATDDGTLVGEADVGGPIRSLGASLSSHEVYVSIDDPPRLAVVSRFSLSVREVMGSAAPILEFRPGVFGETLFVRTTNGIGELVSGEETMRPLAGAWRSDLPLGVSSGRTIILADDEAHLLAVDDAVGSVLAGGAPTWWVPLRWNPGRERIVDQQAVTTGTDLQTPDVAVSEPEVDPSSIPDSTAGKAGHYAIVVSARERSGVADLLGTLADAGYPTRLQLYPDEAGNTWFRGLVGPYPTRGRAQAAARQLQREHDLQAWVTELGGTR